MACGLLKKTEKKKHGSSPCGAMGMGKGNLDRIPSKKIEKEVKKEKIAHLTQQKRILNLVSKAENTDNSASIVNL